MIQPVYELHIIRIGESLDTVFIFEIILGGVYKVFVRTNAGNEMVVERVELNDKYKLWIDAIGELFGGLEIGDQLILAVNIQFSMVSIYFQPV